MAETAPQTQASSVEDLAAQIESLLGGAQDAPAAPPPPAAPPESAAPPSPEISHDDVGKAVEQMLEEAIAKVEEIREQTAPPPSQGPQQAPPSPTAPADQDLAAQIEDLTSLAEAATGNTPAPEIARRPAPSAPAPASPASAHSPAPAPAAATQESNSTPAGESPNAGAHAATPAQTPVPHAKQAETPAPAIPAQSPPPPSSVPQAHAASEAAVSPTAHEARHGPAHSPAATPPAATAPHVSIGARVRSAFGKVAALCVKPVAGAAAIFGKVLAFPLAGRPAIIRDSAGWIAVVTLFMSICMWAAVLLRDPKPFVPAVPPVELMHTAPKEGESHGEKKTEHGAKKEEGHGAKKAESHGGAKKEGHGGEAKAEGHGSGGPPASPIAKREPLIQRGGAKPAPKKKEAEGGEGHH